MSDIDAVKAMLMAEQARRRYAEGIVPLETRRNCLSAFYRNAMDEIAKAGSCEWGIDPYEVDWIRVFTPIEAALWHDIRAENVVMYPQFPIKGYFVDFANPVAAVCIECDGARWHADTAKDEARQRVIERFGWTVYRISGRDCKSDSDAETGAPGAATQFIRQIAANHRISRG